MSRAEKKALEAQAKAQLAAKRKRRIKFLGGLAIVVLAVLALPMLVCGALVAAACVRWPDRLYSRALTLLGIIPAVVCLLLVADYWEAYTGLWSGDTSRFGTVVAFGLGFAPLLGGLGARTWRKYREASPLQGPDATAKREQLEDRRRTATAHRVQEWAHHPEKSGIVAAVAKRAAVPEGNDRGPYVGRYLRGDLPWKSKNGSRALIPMGSAGHIWASGATRQGKSEFVLGMVEWLLSADPELQVVYLNAKESAADSLPSRRLLAHADALQTSCRVLVPSVRPYDFMRGNPTEIRQRLMDVELFSEPHHEAGTNVTLAFALHKLAMEGKPAAALQDVLREMVSREKVAQWATSDPFAARLIDTIDDRSWNGAVQRYTADALDLTGWAGPPAAGGFAIEDARVSCLDLPTSSEPKAARMLLRLVLSDLEAYLSSPRRRKRADGSNAPLVVVLEELSAVDTDPVIGRRVANMMERMAGGGGKAILVTQDLLGLGDERVQSSVLNNATVATFRQSNDGVEDLVKAAGTRQAPEASGTYEGRVRGIRKSSSGSVRMQEQYAVHPNEVRNLRKGECFVIHNGRFMKVASTMRPLGYGVPNSDRVKELDAARARAQQERAQDTGMSGMDVGGQIVIGGGGEL